MTTSMNLKSMAIAMLSITYMAVDNIRADELSPRASTFAKTFSKEALDGCLQDFDKRKLKPVMAKADDEKLVSEGQLLETRGMGCARMLAHRFHEGKTYESLGCLFRQADRQVTVFYHSAENARGSINFPNNMFTLDIKGIESTAAINVMYDRRAHLFGPEEIKTRTPNQIVDFKNLTEPTPKPLGPEFPMPTVPDFDQYIRTANTAIKACFRPIS